MQTKNDPRLKASEKVYIYNRRPMTVGIGLGVLLVAEILAVVATYATPDNELLWQFSTLISYLGEMVFPLIAKYATYIQPPLPPEVLYKTQAVMTLFLLGGAVWAILFIPYLISLSREDFRLLDKIQARRNSWLARNPLLIVPFGILLGLACFLGWYDFDADPAYLSHSRCYFKAACYAHDDLLLIANGYFRIFGSYGFWLGSLIMLKKGLLAD
jgi:hypothetical protein